MGNKVKERRKELGMSQEELAKKSGISRQTVSSIENEPNWTGSTKTIAALATALETTAGTLFFNSDV